MIKVAIVGASGYAGAELCRLISRHSHLELSGLFVSARSEDQGKLISDLYGNLKSICDLPLEPLTDANTLIGRADAVFLATDHKVSHDLAPALVAANIAVFDLSGAFRISDPEVFAKAYGFEHEHLDLLKTAVYALGEYVDVKALQNTHMISLPGCYPTASQLGLRPLIDHDFLDKAFCPVIDAVSGVSGAGRKAKLTNSFCEVSLNAYGVFTHRHSPEICEHLGTKVIFTPHLGNFKRGIHATITCKLKAGVTAEQVIAAFESAYAHKSLVRFNSQVLPKLANVQNTPFCDLGVKVADGYVVVCSSIDNLLKPAGKATSLLLSYEPENKHARSCYLHYGFKETEALI